ncbi:DUF6286 domain-containing protein [Nocardia blacklockiae]|uniref:DUF6286 domain-containing protein n=1 Tax=Nocardia blacklockiae TaxID=480036 RepID=UPI0018963633|nr:DUF6286 domain-containing protein [Nocardia blacklockiae]MBF6174871.1 hypothetical protein [Nocardia blacklockiae]
MKRRPNRAVPAAVLALTLSAGCVVVVLSLVRYLTGATGPVSYDAVTERLRETTWADGWVAVFGAAALLAGIVLLGLAVLPGRAVVLPLDSDDVLTAGVVRRGLRAALRDAAQSVDGVHSARVRLRRKAVRITVRAPRAHRADLAETVRAAVDERVACIGPQRPPRVSARLRATGSLR